MAEKSEPKCNIFILRDAFTCIIEAQDKEIERLKKHVELGHKGTGAEPRDYPSELKSALHMKEKILNAYEEVKAVCEIIGRKRN